MPETGESADFNPPPEPPQTLDLETVVGRQVDRYIKLGFHRLIYRDLPEEAAIAKYKADFALPQGAAQAEEYKGRFDIALVVDPRASLWFQYNVIDNRVEGLTSIKDRSDLIDIKRIADQTEHPDGPYLIFTHDGQRYKTEGLYGRQIKEMQASFAQDEVGNTLHEATGLYIQYPEYFGDGRGSVAAGSRDEHGDVPLFAGYKGYQTVGAFKEDDNISQNFGAFSRGRNVIELGSPKVPMATPQKVAA